MNQIFNFSRFIKYATYQTRIRRNIYLPTIAGFSVALFLFMLFLLSVNSYWKQNEWTVLFFTSFAITGLLLIGNAFPSLRNKEKRINMLMLPVSVFEKYTYEYIIKVVLFAILYPLLFVILSSLAVHIAGIINPDKTILSFSFDPILHPRHDYVMRLIFWIYLFSSSLIFAGAAAIKKHPLIKTLLLVGTVIMGTIGYFYIIFKELRLGNGIQYVAKNTISDEKEAFTWLFTLLGISACTALTYAFFKLKEKEV